jgi:rubrerythrin
MTYLDTIKRLEFDPADPWETGGQFYFNKMLNHLNGPQEVDHFVRWCNIEYLNQVFRSENLAAICYKLCVDSTVSDQHLDFFKNMAEEEQEHLVLWTELMKKVRPHQTYWDSDFYADQRHKAFLDQAQQLIATNSYTELLINFFLRETRLLLIFKSFYNNSVNPYKRNWLGKFIAEESGHVGGILDIVKTQVAELDQDKKEKIYHKLIAVTTDMRYFLLRQMNPYFADRPNRLQLLEAAYASDWYLQDYLTNMINEAYKVSAVIDPTVSFDQFDSLTQIKDFSFN